MDQFKLFLHSLSIRDLDELLGDAQHDRSEGSKGGANNGVESDNSYIQATIEGMKRQIDILTRGVAQLDDSFEFGSPLSDEIHLCMPSLDYKDPKFYKFNEEGDPKRHLQGFKDECELKINVDLRLQVKFFPHSLEGEACEWFYSLLERLITSFRELSTLF